MADDTLLNLGSGGDLIASDDIAGVKFQRVKLIHGADGVNAGDVGSANPYPVDNARWIGSTAPTIGQKTSASSIPVVQASNASNLIDAAMNQTAQITPLRDLIVAQKTRIMGDSFADGIGSGPEDTAFPATATLTGSATGAVTGGALVCRTGATTGSTGSLRSTNAATFLTGSVSNMQSGVLLPSASLTSFKFFARKAGADTEVDSAAFNVVTGTAIVDGLFHRYELFWLANSCVFMIDGAAYHRMPGAVNTPRTESMDFNLTYEWINTAAPSARIRFGSFTDLNGYFVEANYSIADVTFQVRGTSSNRFGSRALSDADASNITQINSIAIATGNGVAGTAVQRVAIASDNSVLPISGTVSGTGTFISAGDIAHDSVDSGNPVKIGGVGRTTDPTAVGALDRVNTFFDVLGKLVVVMNAPRGRRIRNTITLTLTTETTLLAAAASTFHDLTKVTVSNTSATAVRVDFRDTTAGTIAFSLQVPAGQTVGFADSADPVEQTTLNTNWTAQLSAAVTDVRIFSTAVKKTA